jgi:hypothetical protein
MRRRYSITDDPDFRWIVFVIGILLLSAFYVNYKSGGIFNGVSSVIHDVYNLGYTFVFVFFIFVVIVWTFYKRDLLVKIGLQIAQWIWSFVHRRKR